MKTTTACSLAALASALVIVSPQVSAALSSADISKLGLTGSEVNKVQGNKSFKGWGDGYGVPEGQKGSGGGGGGAGGGASKGGGDGGYGGGQQKGGAGGGTWEGKGGGGGGGSASKGGGAGGYGGGQQKGGAGGGTWEGKGGGGGMSKGGGGGTWEGKRGGGGGGVWMREGRRYRDGRGPRRFYDGRAFRYRAPCAWMRERARDTGSRYWWRRYRDCVRG